MVVHLAERWGCNKQRDLWVLSILVGLSGPSGTASPPDQGLDLQANTRAHSIASAFPAHERRCPRVVRLSGAGKGLPMALTRFGSRWIVRSAGKPSTRLPLGPALVLLLLASCRGDSGSRTVAAPSSTTSIVATVPSTAMPTSTTADPAVEIVARYKQFWEVRFEVNRTPVNPVDPRLAQFATGKQLDNVVTETRQRLNQGLAVRRPEPSASKNRVKVVQVAGDTASLQDCATNDGIVYRVATGQVLDDGVVTRSVEATMRRVDGVWRLADSRVVQEWKGVAGCALSPDFS